MTNNTQDKMNVLQSVVSTLDIKPLEFLKEGDVSEQITSYLTEQIFDWSQENKLPFPKKLIEVICAQLVQLIIAKLQSTAQTYVNQQVEKCISSQWINQLLNNQKLQNRLIDKLKELLTDAQLNYQAKQWYEKQCEKGNVPEIYRNYLTTDQQTLALLIEQQIQQEQTSIQTTQILENVTAIKAQLKPQPKLYFDSITAHSELHYRQKITPLFGRDQQLQQLDEFVNSSENTFQWWLLSGRGGMGKSRLIWDWTQRLVGWRVGYLSSYSKIDDFDWDNWEPEKPTIIMLDYVAKFETTGLIRLLKSYCNNANNFQFPVRILFIERHYYAQLHWWEELSKEEFCTKDGTLNQHNQAYQTTPLNLDAMAAPQKEEVALNIVQHILTPASNHNTPDKQQISNDLANIDPHFQPLYAIIYALFRNNLESDSAQNVDNNIDNSKLNKKELFDWYLRHLDRTAEPLENDAEQLGHKLLLSLATAVNRLEFDSSSYETLLSDCKLNTKAFKKTFAQHIILPQQRIDIKDGFLNNYTYFALGEKNTLTAIQPDLVGSFFFLKTLQQCCDNTQQEFKIASLHHWLWNNHPVAYAEFLIRSFNDYGNQADFKSLLLNLLTPPEDDNAKPAWIFFIFHLTAPPIQSQWLIPITEHFITTTQTKPLPTNSATVFVTATTLVNLIAHFSETPSIETIQRLHQSFDTVFNNLPKDISTQHFGEIYIEKAKATFNLINAYVNADSLDKAEALYQSFDTLLNELPADTSTQHLGEIYIAKAKATVNLINAYGKAGNLDKAEQLYQSFDTLLNELPENTSIQHLGEIYIEKAKANVNLISDYGKAGNPDKAEALCQSFDTLLNELPAGTSTQHLGEISILKAKATFNLINAYGKAGNPNKAEAVYQSFDTLLNDLSEDTSTQHLGELYLVKTNATENLISFLATAESYNQKFELELQLNLLSSLGILVTLGDTLPEEEISTVRELWKFGASLVVSQLDTTNQEVLKSPLLKAMAANKKTLRPFWEILLVVFQNDLKQLNSTRKLTERKRVKKYIQLINQRFMDES